MEACETGRAFLALALGRGPSRLAHRMLGHVDEPARQLFRHPRRRRGLEVSASRERDRAVLRRLRYALRARVDAQRVRARERRENVEVARQFLYGARGSEDTARSGSAALLSVEQPLSRAHQLFVGAARASGRDLAGAVPRAQGCAAGRGRRRCANGSGDFAPPWTTISIHRRRWRSCRAWRGNSIRRRPRGTRRRRPARRRRCAPWARCSACCSRIRIPI